MIYIDCCKDTPDDFVITGFYFRPVSHICEHYLIAIRQFSDHSVVTVNKIGIPQNGEAEITIQNGQSIKASEAELICTIDLWGKYFFTKYKNDMQMYYDGEAYNSGKDKTDSVMAIAEAVNYAIKIGLDKTGIKPY